ncbi:MAG: glutamate--tRNA ligase [Flavobacteriales bacterium]
MPEKFRVRFAPSPTGPLHIGGLRCALFNYLFARKKKGVFILRIEDTDQSRFEPRAEKFITESLKWCGLTPDEGIEQGGLFGPYRQSERKHIYKQFAEKLIEEGKAYYAFDTPQELEEVRSAWEKNSKDTWQYSATTRMKMRNSLSLDSAQTKHLLNSGASSVIRIKIDAEQFVEFEDIIRGKVQVNSSVIDDKVILKSDGMPTYHLANVVDDHLMKISHVIRGEEWLPSTPLHILLYRYLGWEEDMPHFAHLPLILKPTGKGKLSKRDGDKGGFPVFPLQWPMDEEGSDPGYRELGFFPEPFVNMLALLGWNPGDEREIFSLEALIDAFSLDGVNKSGARFDYNRAVWFNEQYLRSLDNEKITDIAQPLVQEKFKNVNRDYLLSVVGLMKDRISFVRDIPEKAAFFFQAPPVFDEKLLLKKWKPKFINALRFLEEKLSVAEAFDAETVEQLYKETVENLDIGFGAFLPVLRVLITGTGKGPSLFQVISVLGRDETCSRIRSGITKFTSHREGISNGK